MEKRFDQTTYIICHNGSDVIHPVQVEAGTLLTTGQPNVEEFEDKAAWEARLTELGFNTAKLAPSPFDERVDRAGRPGFLSAEERKSLRRERMAARKAKASL